MSRYISSCSSLSAKYSRQSLTRGGTIQSWDNLMCPQRIYLLLPSLLMHWPQLYVPYDKYSLKQSPRMICNANNKNVLLTTNLTRQPAPSQEWRLVVQRLCQAFLGDFILQFAVGGAASLLLKCHHGPDTGVHLQNKNHLSYNIWLNPLEALLQFYIRVPETRLSTG